MQKEDDVLIEFLENQMNNDQIKKEISKACEEDPSIKGKK